jgi:AraC-like DNA-binding protein
MSTSAEYTKTLVKLIGCPPTKRLSDAAQVVALHRGLIRKAIRRGHSLQTLAAELHLPKRTLQRHLNLSGLFFRKPRTNKGSVIRPYKPRKKG